LKGITRLSTPLLSYFRSPERSEVGNPNSRLALSVMKRALRVENRMASIVIFGGLPVIFVFISIPRSMTLAALLRGRFCSSGCRLTEFEKRLPLLNRKVNKSWRTQELSLEILNEGRESLNHTLRKKLLKNRLRTPPTNFRFTINPEVDDCRLKCAQKKAGVHFCLCLFYSLL